MSSGHWFRSSATVSFSFRSRLIARSYYQPSKKVMALLLRNKKWLVHVDVEAKDYIDLVESAFPGHFYETVLKARLTAPLPSLSWKTYRIIREIRKAKVQF